MGAPRGNDFLFAPLGAGAFTVSPERQPEIELEVLFGADDDLPLERPHPLVGLAELKPRLQVLAEITENTGVDALQELGLFLGGEDVDDRLRQKFQDAV